MQTVISGIPGHKGTDNSLVKRVKDRTNLFRPTEVYRNPNMFPEGSEAYDIFLAMPEHIALMSNDELFINLPSGHLVTLAQSTGYPLTGF